MWRDAWKHRRCLIPAAAWYEWRATPAGKRKHRLTTADGLVVLAGLWAEPVSRHTPLPSAAILTTAARSEIAHIHDRMPVVLDPDRTLAWVTAGTGLSAGADSAETADPILVAEVA